MADDALTLADALFSAIEAGDVDRIRQIYAPGIAVWHNFDGKEQTLDENLATLGWVTKNVEKLRYEDVRRQPTPTGFVQQHVLRGTAPNGAELEVPACLVVTCEGGHITRIDEYLDTAQVAALTG